MDKHRSNTPLAIRLENIAADFQKQRVIQHCTKCMRPCCKLDTLVLELNWKQVKTLWERVEPRAAFDKLLSEGKGPQEIRAGNHLYYIHTKPCPAYDDAGGLCRVYDQPIKPVGCSDFPVYAEGNTITADLRCEAVNINALVQFVNETLGQKLQAYYSSDKTFPFLATVRIKPRRP